MRYQTLTFIGLITATLAGAQHNTLTPAEQAAGYELLFDGKAISNAGNGVNWVTYSPGSETNTGIETGWKIFAADSAFGKDGVPGNPRDIRSKKKYKDFIAQFDFWTNGNSGFYYRTMVDGQYGWETGVEFAIEDNETLLPWIKSGAAYELIVANPSTYKKAAWNSVKVIAIADSVEHWMNGTKVVAYKYWDDQWTKAFNGQVTGVNGARSKWNGFNHFCRPTAGAKTGYIQEGYFGLQGDHPNTTKFRNFKVAPMTQWTTALGDATDRNATARTVLMSRIGASETANGITLELDFKTPYVATIMDLTGRQCMQKVNASEPKSLALNRGEFKPGVYFLAVKVANTTLQKKLTLR